jgi:hypothetical protein
MTKAHCRIVRRVALLDPCKISRNLLKNTSFNNPFLVSIRPINFAAKMAEALIFLSQSSLRLRLLLANFASQAVLRSYRIKGRHSCWSPREPAAARAALTLFNSAASGL